MAGELCFFDSEFTRVSNPKLRTVSGAVLFMDKVHSWWTDDIKGYAEARTFFLHILPKDTVIVCFNVESEARFLISLGIDPRQYKWQCLYLEYLMLMNHNHEIAYGKHLMKDGSIRRLRPFIDEKGGTGLASALWKFCEVKIDTEHKNTMRDLIISDPYSFTSEEKAAILKYNESDITHLPALRRAMKAYIEKKLPKEAHATWMEDSMRRADYAVETAWMVTHGYPIQTEWTRNLTENVEPLLDACVRDINSQFPDYPPFSFDAKDFRWKQNQKSWRQWIRDNGHEKGWPLTDGGKSGKKELSLSIDAWTDRFDFKHTYPRGNFGAQIVRYLKLKQSLNGFREKAGKDKKTFWEYVGSDGRVRPYFNIYGAQSSRTQPSATGYIFLKPAWQRTVVHPPKGKMIVGIDYASQEFLLSALFSGDKNMIEAYRSGDVYLAFGKLIGLIPKDGTKATHKFQRDACKSTVLGLSYLMTEIGLAKKLTVDTGRVWSEEEAREQVIAFDEAFDVFSDFRREVISDYHDRGYLKLKDGWVMFGNNNNNRSVGNCPIQGAGGDIMRRAVMRCTRGHKLKVIKTLHDAVYIECDLNDWDSVILFINSMRDGFSSYFEGTDQYENSKMIRLDTYAWGDGLEDGELTSLPNGHKVSTMPLYIDERAVEEFDHFKSFFMEGAGVDAL